MDNGMSMREIDSMDMIGYISLRAWKVKKKHEKKHGEKSAKAGFIDQIWNF